VSGGCYALSARHWTGNALQKFVKTDSQSLKQSKQMCFRTSAHFSLRLITYTM